MEGREGWPSGKGASLEPRILCFCSLPCLWHPERPWASHLASVGWGSMLVSSSRLPESCNSSYTDVMPVQWLQNDRLESMKGSSLMWTGAALFPMCFSFESKAGACRLDLACGAFGSSLQSCGFSSIWWLRRAEGKGFPALCSHLAPGASAKATARQRVLMPIPSHPSWVIAPPCQKMLLIPSISGKCIHTSKTCIFKSN